MKNDAFAQSTSYLGKNDFYEKNDIFQKEHEKEDFAQSYVLPG